MVEARGFDPYTPPYNLLFNRTNYTLFFLIGTVHRILAFSPVKPPAIDPALYWKMVY
jgi:hypothetical protein